jgi:hypothetical protein
MNGATLVVVLFLSGCASQPQSITGETPTPTLRRELYRLENSKEDGQQLADYLRIAQIRSQRLDQTQPGWINQALIHRLRYTIAQWPISLSVGQIKAGLR